MKNEVLKKLIKEEIKKILNENTPPEPKTPKNTPPKPKKPLNINQKLLNLQKNLKNREGLNTNELELLFNLLDILIDFARESNLSPSIITRISSIISPSDNEKS